MLHYFVLYKPYEVLTQFSPEAGKKTLKDCVDLPSDVYPVGRLDYDSEGLLILTNDKSLNALLLHPRHAHERTYLVQVEGDITGQALASLSKGVSITVNGKPYQTLPAKATRLENEPALPERIPPIRFRRQIPTTWIRLQLKEGKNRQVRRMTAAVGFPTLRLVRYSIGGLTMEGWRSGELRAYPKARLMQLLFPAA